VVVRNNSRSSSQGHQAHHVLTAVSLVVGSPNFSLPRLNIHLVRLAACEHCGISFARLRSSRRFCSERCKKAASRAACKAASGDEELFAKLKNRGMIGQIWLVYTWDDTPPVYGLMFPRQFVLNELNANSEAPHAESEVVRVLKAHDVADWGEPVEARLIADFYSSRRARRVARREALSGTEIGDKAE
jgi:hypothetical protein